jgi:hypothetical protein
MDFMNALSRSSSGFTAQLTVSGPRLMGFYARLMLGATLFPLAEVTLK